MSLTYTESKVTWKYNGKKYEYNIDNIISSSLKKKYIYIYSKYNNDKVVRAYTFLTLNGVLIFSHYAGSDTEKIKMLNEENKEIFLEFPYRIDTVTNGTSVFIIEDAHQVIQYSVHGNKLKAYPVLTNFNIGRFFDLPDSDKEIKVICHGPEDKYGKDTYCLALNLETGEWTVLYSMLDK